MCQSCRLCRSLGCSRCRLRCCLRLRRSSSGFAGLGYHCRRDHTRQCTHCRDCSYDCRDYTRQRTHSRECSHDCSFGLRLALCFSLRWYDRRWGWCRNRWHARRRDWRRSWHSLRLSFCLRFGLRWRWAQSSQGRSCSKLCKEWRKRHRLTLRRCRCPPLFRDQPVVLSDTVSRSSPQDFEPVCDRRQVRPSWQPSLQLIQVVDQETGQAHAQQAACLEREAVTDSFKRSLAASTERRRRLRPQGRTAPIASRHGAASQPQILCGMAGPPRRESRAKWRYY